MTKNPPKFKARKFKDPHAAIDAVNEIYNANIEYLRSQFDSFAKGVIPGARVQGFYPYIRLEADLAKRVDTRLSYGFVSKPGIYETTVTRPDIFSDYLFEQVRLLLLNHETPIEIGVSETSIPIHFALGEEFHLEGDLTAEQINALPLTFDQPDLSIMDDEVANGTHIQKPGEPSPLSLFRAPRIDLSLLRLKHYTGTAATHFQNYVIYTNYQF
ncbi:MAG: AMP nucleosidase, partial [Alphaproteobacteria bacterium]|nr:AMP nucleosidase [Alphaproteobacteria bacterium]